MLYMWEMTLTHLYDTNMARDLRTLSSCVESEHES